jgi:hypothetical protein
MAPEHEHVDRLAMAMFARRGAVGVLGAGLLARVLGPLGQPASAKKRRRRCPCPPKPPTCAKACAGTCQFCLTRTDGPPLCAGEVEPDCERRCDSDNDCLDSPGATNRAYCVTQFVNRQTGQVRRPCGRVGGRCTAAASCAS